MVRTLDRPRSLRRVAGMVLSYCAANGQGRGGGTDAAGSEKMHGASDESPVSSLACYGPGLHLLCTITGPVMRLFPPVIADNRKAAFHRQENGAFPTLWRAEIGSIYPKTPAFTPRMQKFPCYQAKQHPTHEPETIREPVGKGPPPAPAPTSYRICLIARTVFLLRVLKILCMPI